MADSKSILAGNVPSSLYTIADHGDYDFEANDYPLERDPQANESEWPVEFMDGYYEDEIDPFDMMTAAEYAEAWEMGELYYQFVLQPHPLEIKLPRFGARNSKLCPRFVLPSSKCFEGETETTVLRDERFGPRRMRHRENKSNTLRERTVRRYRQERQRWRESLLADLEYGEE